MKTLLILHKHNPKNGKLEDDLYKKVYELVSKIIRISKIDKEIKDDITQEVVLKIFLYFKKITEENINKINNFDNYMWITVKRMVFKELHKIKTQPILESIDDMLEYYIGNDDNIISLKKIIINFPAKEKAVISMRIYGYTNKEISKELGIANQKVSDIMSKIKNKFMEVL